MTQVAQSMWIMSFDNNASIVCNIIRLMLIFVLLIRLVPKKYNEYLHKRGKFELMVYFIFAFSEKVTIR